MWLFITNDAKFKSSLSSTSSFTTQRISNLDKIGSVNSTFSLKLSWELYLPYIGLATAITAHLAFKLATIPAFEILMDYCSMASWIEVLSLSFILSNSSIRQIPLSAMTKAPPSNVHSLV